MVAFEHQPVLLTEVMEGLRPRAGGRYVDGTVGGGGHAAAVLRASSPDGWLFGCDRDPDAVVAARSALVGFAGRVQLRRASYAGLTDWIEPASCDGVLLDLGVSSPQLDRAERGFSFQLDGPLDMRMDPGEVRTAADLVNDFSADELERLFRKLGEEPEARRLARAIERERRCRRFETTRQLAGFLERVCRRRGHRTHPATRVFQALRLAVNDEPGHLRLGLAAATGVLRPGGRLAVITFHSGEDRMVKQFGNEQSRGYVVPGEVDVPELRRPVPSRLRWVSRRAVMPSASEVASNPRSRSAQLRVLERTDYGE